MADSSVSQTTIMTLKLIQILGNVKVFIYQTTNYALRRASEDFYRELDGAISKFIFAMNGGRRQAINLMNNTVSLALNEFGGNFVLYLDETKKFLLGELSESINIEEKDLFLIRDEILTIINLHTIFFDNTNTRTH